VKERRKPCKQHSWSAPSAVPSGQDRQPLANGRLDADEVMLNPAPTGHNTLTPLLTLRQAEATN